MKTFVILAYSVALFSMLGCASEEEKEERAAKVKQLERACYEQDRVGACEQVAEIHAAEKERREHLNAAFRKGLEELAKPAPQQVQQQTAVGSGT